MTIAASIPVANLMAANAELEAKGFGPNNFRIPVYTTGPAPTHATLHCGGNVRDASGNEEYPGSHNFLATIKALDGVQFYDPDEPEADQISAPKARVREACPSGSKFGFYVEPLAGSVTAGNLYYTVDGDSRLLWWVIQSYDADVYSDPTVIPALVRRARVPGVVEPWVQPIDQYDAYKLENPFTGQPDRVTHAGQTWDVTQADGSGNNVWAPGVFGWVIG